MKIVFLDRETLGLDIDLEKFGSLGDVVIYETTSANETLTRLIDCDIVVTNKVVIDKEIIENTNLKLICVAATGTNNIDLEAASSRGIPVKNAADYSTSSVAQVTFAIAFHFIQKLDYYTKYVDDGLWEKSEIFTHIDKPFFELKNKNWGIIGLGNIGTEVANIAKSFGCNVNYYSVSGLNQNTNFNQILLENLLSESDIISIHSPLTNKSYNLLNKSNLNMLKEDAILINVGRGGIINEDDLAKVLDEEKSLYCGLDVLEHEPIRSDNPLKFIQNKDRLIITPHIAWSSIEARNKLVNIIFDNIKNFIV